MTSQTGNEQTMTPSQWIRLLLFYLLIPFVLFICGGDLEWWQAWVYSGLLVISGIEGRILAEKRHPGILAERINVEKMQEAKAWDKVLAPLMAISLSFPLVIVAGLDHRYGWTLLFPTWLNLFGLLLIALGYAFSTWALIENRFFSSTVRIQKERGHRVCDSGPYRFLRHPGYAGNLFALPGIILALESVWTLIPVIFAVVIMVTRTALEDQTLQKELDGYREYAQGVRYRLIPWVY